MKKGVEGRYRGTGGWRKEWRVGIGGQVGGERVEGRV